MYYISRRTRYNDGFLDMARKGLGLVKVPLKAMGDAGLRILEYVSSTVKYLTLIYTTRAVFNYMEARDRLKIMAERLNWSEELVNASAGDYKKKQAIKLGLSLLKGAVAMAITLVSDKIIAAAKKKIREK